jgi:hypothetical protein
VAGIALAAVRGLAAWRALKRFRRTVLAGMDELNRRVVALEKRADTLPAKAERLDEARASLEQSLAEARVIANAFGEAAAMVRAARILVGLR